MADDYDARPVRPDGLAVRRIRHERGWGPRDLIDAIALASRRASGVARTITPNLLLGIEEHDEEVPYETLCLVAGGLDCDPIDITRGSGAPRALRVPRPD